MSQKQTLILIVSRFQLDTSLVAPLKIIIPMLDNLYPVRVFTSLDRQILPSKSATVYEQLIKKLQNNSGYCCLTATLQQIVSEYDQKNNNNYRICIIGHERVDWGVIMQFKRRGIVVDTVDSSADKSQLLVQISYITGGVFKIVKQSTMVRTFQAEIGINSKMRSSFKIDRKDTVQFSLKCFSCAVQITKQFQVCSICLAAYCLKHDQMEKCAHCGYELDI